MIVRYIAQVQAGTIEMPKKARRYISIPTVQIYSFHQFNVPNFHRKKISVTS